jgi:exo-beta-1,3-glucanase (GH17 family)
VSTKQETKGKKYQYLIRTYIHDMATLTEVKPEVTKSGAVSDVTWSLKPGKYIIATVATARSGYAMSVFKIEVGANVLIKKVGITFIKRLDEVRDKIAEMVAGKTTDKPKEDKSIKPKPKPRVDEVEDEDVDEGGEE